jgi:hypothetical protein
MSLSQPQPQLQHQLPINLDDGKRHKLDKKITEEELRRRSSEVEDEASSFEEIMVQKKLVKEGKIEVVENPRFMTEARRKELERRRKEESSTAVVKEEKRKFSLFPHHHRSKSNPPSRSSSLNRTRKLVVHPRFLPVRSRIRFSFESYRFSSKTEQFSFEKLVYRWPERVLRPPPVYTAILTHAAA